MEWIRSASVLFFSTPCPPMTQWAILKLVSGMGKLLKEPALMEQLKTAPTARELLELFGRVSLRK